MGNSPPLHIAAGPLLPWLATGNWQLATGHCRSEPRDETIDCHTGLQRSLNLSLLHERLARIAARAADDYEIIFVNDGSADGSLAAMGPPLRPGPARPLHLSQPQLRPPGSPVPPASTARPAMPWSSSTPISRIPPRSSPKWSTGRAAAQRSSTDAAGPVLASPLSRSGPRHLFYRMLSRISDVNIPLDPGDFRLMDRRVVDVLRSCREFHCLRGLVAWIGFKQEAAEYERAGRHAGRSNYTLGKMIRLAWAGACASLVPLQLAFWCGGLLLLAGLIPAIVLALRAVFSCDSVSGWAMLGCGMMTIAGVQLLILGVVARYIGCILQSVQGRPLYVVEAQGGWDRPGNQPPLNPPADPEPKYECRAGDIPSGSSAASTACPGEQAPTRQAWVLLVLILLACAPSAPVWPGRPKVSPAMVTPTSAWPASGGTTPPP